MKTYLRKGFYFIDLLIVSIYVVFMWHGRYHASLFFSRPLFFQWAILLYPMLLRVTADFLLYHREKRSLWTILAFMVGYIGMIQVYIDSYLHLAWFPFLLCDTRNAAASLSNIRMNTFDTGSILAVLILLAWIVLVPIIIYLILFFRKKLSSGAYSWWDIFGLMMFKDHSGKAYLSLAAIMFLAYTSGLYSVMFISKVALFTLPAITYCVVNRYIDRKAVWYELFVVIVAMIFFFEAQFKVNASRIAFLTVSACIVMVLCIWMGMKSGKVKVAVFTFLLTAFIVPSFSIGYNVYRVIDETIRCPYQDEYVTRGVFITKKWVKGDVLYGLRDRYRTVIQANFLRVEPYDWYNHEVAFSLPNGKLVYNVKTQSLVHSFTSQDNNLRDYLQFTSFEELQNAGFDSGQIIVMETHTGKIMAMVKFGGENTYQFSSVHQSGLMKPVALLAAMEVGAAKPSDCMKRGLDQSAQSAVSKALAKSPNSYFDALSCIDSSDRDSVYGIDNVPSIPLHKYVLPRKVTAEYASRFVSGCENAIAPLQMLVAYNVIWNEGLQYMTLLYEDTPSCRFDMAKPENTRAVKALVDKNFSDECRKMGMSIHDISGYYSTQKYGHSYSVDFCGYYPKKSPRYSFILSLDRGDALADNRALFGTIQNIVRYLNTGKEPVSNYSEKLRKEAEHNRLAQYRLGECYEYGYGIGEDNEKAANYYLMSAENGYVLAQWRMYVLMNDGWLSDDGIARLEGNDIPWLIKCADQGYSKAEFSLGSAYFLKYCPPPAGISAKEEAIRWFRKAEKNGDSMAREYLQSKKMNNQYGF